MTSDDVDDDWTTKEYKLLFGNETPIPSDDEFDWSMEHEKLFEKSLGN